MCDPVTLGVMTAVSVAGTALSGVSQIQQANYQAKVADANAQQQTQAAADAQTQGQITLRDQYRKAAQLKGDQLAAMSANGIDTSFGTALGLQQDTTQQTYDDGQSTRWNIDQEMRGHEISAANYTAQASAARASKVGIVAQTAAQMGSTIAGSAMQLRGMQASSGGFGSTGAPIYSGSDWSKWVKGA
jgi:hypothetical protein